jgi:ParB family chromosome partitioning protein
MVIETTTLARISQAKLALVSAKNLDDVLRIRDQAEALRIYIKAASDSLEAANSAAEIKLRAERRAGEMLAGMEKPLNQHGKVAPNTMLGATLESFGVSYMQSSRWQKEAKVNEDTFEEYIRECNDEQREVTQAGLLKLADPCHVSHNSVENEWYTPSKYIEAARTVMGSIDLDPASCELAQETVQASQYFTIDENGLTKEWRGNVWLNPPYSKESVGLFAAKLVEETANLSQAIVLVNNATDTQWFHEIASVATAICFVRGRIKFNDKNGKPANTPVQGQVCIYVGGNAEKFCLVFSSFGIVARF